MIYILLGTALSIGVFYLFAIKYAHIFIEDAPKDYLALVICSVFLAVVVVSSVDRVVRREYFEDQQSMIQITIEERILGENNRTSYIVSMDSELFTWTGRQQHGFFPSERIENLLVGDVVMARFHTLRAFVTSVEEEENYE